MKKNSAAGPDGIDPQIIKLAADVLVDPLTRFLLVTFQIHLNLLA